MPSIAGGAVSVSDGRDGVIGGGGMCEGRLRTNLKTPGIGQEVGKAAALEVSISLDFDTSVI